MHGFNLSEWEKAKTCSTKMKLDLSVFDLSVVKLVTQRADFVALLQKSFDLAKFHLTVST